MNNFIKFYYALCVLSPVISGILIFITYGFTSGVGDSVDSSYYTNGYLDVAGRAIDYSNANTKLNLIVITILIYLSISLIIIIYSTKKNYIKLLISSFFALAVYLLLLKFDIVV